LPVANAGPDQDICQGESIILTASGGPNILWENGETTASIEVSPLETTTYTVSVYDNEGNFDEDSVIVTVNAIPVAEAGDDNTICEGETITLTASGGTSYLWSNGETTASIQVSPSIDTIYDVEVTTNNCSSTDSVTIFVNDAPDLTVSEDIVLVEGNSTILNVSGSDNYLWSTGETSSEITVAPLVTTSYSVTSIGPNGCSTTIDIIVTVIPEVVANAGPDETICSNDDIILTATGGSTYLWSTGVTTAQIVVSPQQTTTYTVTVTDDYGFSDTDSVTVTVNETPSITVSEDVFMIEGESTTLSAFGGDNYLWSTGETSSSITVSPTETTTYTVTSSGSTGCSATQQITVTVEPLFIAFAGEDRNVCENDTYEVELTANLGDSYLWSTGETTQSIVVSPLSTTTYTVTITSGFQEDIDDVTVYVDPNPNVVIMNGDYVNIMSGDFVTLSATGANSYEWNNGATQPNIAVSPSQTTTYEVRGYINDCYDEKQVIVNIIPEVEANAGEDVEICLGEIVTLTATGGDDYEWSTGESTQSIQVSPDTTTAYTVTVFNALDFDEDSVIVFVDDNCEDNTVEQPETPDSSGDFSFDVFPNPAVNQVNIRLSGSVALSRIYLYDITGKLMYSKIISNDDLSVSTVRTIDVSAFNPGMYYVKMVDVNREISKKLIIK
ncbi:MAG: T9SS type A sorting domain-containing protein, partial [Winogradskyella sp.]|uniref:T9SS type A sorting domain-containing protein n=1 Tax=Winogradskyella sp. TaxID=1883156 RepID=UPI0025CEA084